MKSLFGALLLGVMVLTTGCDETIPLSMQIDGYVFDQYQTPVQDITLSDATVYGLETRQGDFYEDEQGSYFRGIGQKSPSSFQLGTTDSNGRISLTNILKDQTLQMGSSKSPGLFLKQGGRWSVVGLIKVLGNIESNGVQHLITVDTTTNAMKIIEANGSDGKKYEGFIVNLQLEPSLENSSSSTNTSSSVSSIGACQRNPELEACKVLEAQQQEEEQTQVQEDSNVGSIKVSEIYQSYLAKTKLGFVEIWFRPVNSDGRALNFLDTVDLGAQGDIVGSADRSGDLNDTAVYGEEVIIRSSGATAR